ncbi:Lysosomal Pro-X carboxypeptidase [Linum perenne]
MSFSTHFIPTQSKFSKLGVQRRSVDPKQASYYKVADESVDDADYVTYYYNQTLDHFSYKPESYMETFKQRYILNSKYWGGANTHAPIFVYFGHEGTIDSVWSYIGFLTENAPRFKALILYIEHRYYGESIPFGSWKEASTNASSLGYLNSAQAIADYAAIILHVKQAYSAQNSPVIVIGGSYSGMLASWFRLKYPHIAVGALASSAPILYFDGGVAPDDGYYSIVTKDFKEASKNCYETISKSWEEIERVASKPNGLSLLSKKFKTCRPLRRSFDLKDYLDSMYAEAAQYNEPPEYPVGIVCRGIDGAADKSDVLDKIVGGVVAYMGNKSCYEVLDFSPPTASSRAWSWQVCSELVFPIGHDSNTMFPPEPFSLNSFIKKCKTSFGILPQPHWVTTFYGGHDLKLALHRFASNIIFSNGLQDPYSSGG